MHEEDPTADVRRRARVAPGAWHRVAGRYELLRELGRGGMGVVHAARDTLLERDVAVKIIDLGAEGGAVAEVRERFLREARASARLRHPNVVAIHDAGIDPAGAFLVFELIEGEPLSRLLQREGPMTPHRAASVAAQVADGLAAAHGLGIVHRDIKPSNLIACADGTVRIADFGIAHLEDLPRLTQVDAALGTPGYMAPEQLEGEAVGPAADLFSLGCVIFTMLAGRGPFDADSRGRAIARILKGAPDDLPPGVREVAPRLAALVRSMLARRPEDRPRSAAAVRDQLRALEPATEPRASVSPRAPLRNRLLLVAAGVAILASVSLAERFVRPREARPGATTLGEPAPSVPVFTPLQEDVALRRAKAASLVMRMPELPFTTLEVKGDALVGVAGHPDIVADARQLIGVADALDGLDFFKDQNRFNSNRHSERRITLDAHDLDVEALVATIASAIRWPVVADQTLRGRTVTAQVDDAPWDVTLEMLLGGGLGTLRHGATWIVGSRQRCEEMAARCPPAFTVQRPPRARPEALVAAVRAAGSESCAAAWEPSLGAVVIVDRAERLGDIASAWAAVDGVDAASLDFRDAVWRGEPLSVAFQSAELFEVLRLMSQVGAVNMFLEPPRDGSQLITLNADDVPWDNLLDSVLLTRGMTMEREANVVRVFRAGENDAATASAVITLRHLPATFFGSFSGWLAPGSMTVDEGSRTLIVRGTRARVAWFRRFADTLDDMAGPPRP